MKKNDLWYLMTYLDPAALPGQTFLDLFNCISSEVKVKFVIIQDVDGAGVYNILSKQNQIISIEELLRILPEVKQFDWATFFLFVKYPSNWRDEGLNTPYPELVQQTDITVRAIDDTYVDVITKDHKLIQRLKKKYTPKYFTFGSLDSFTYPE